MATGNPPTTSLMDVSEERWAEAVRREPVIRALADNTRNSHASVRGAACDLGLSPSQVYRLVRTFREEPVTKSLVPDLPGPKKGTRLLPAAVEAIVEQTIDSEYKRRERPNQQKLIREIRASCKAAGVKPPSRKAVGARVAARPPKEIMKAREGAKTVQNRLGTAKPGLRPTAPLEIVQIDHTKSDIQLVDDLHRKPLGRPWLTIVLDVWSRCVIGFYVSLDPPSAAGVALAIAQAALPKSKWLDERGLNDKWPVQGLPRKLCLDNGSDFRSRALKRGCEQYGIEIDYRIPGKPHYGGHIERLMGTLMTRIHALPGSTSSNVVERGDYRSEQKAILTLREFEQYFAREVLAIYHNQPHTGLSGRTPLSVWEEDLGRISKARLHLSDPEAVVLAFLPFEKRFVGRQGVRLFNLTYFADALGTLLGGPDRKRPVKYDPRDLSAVFVEMPDGTHVRAPLADPSKPAFTLWEHQKAVSTLREQGRATINEDAISAGIMANRETLAQARVASKSARRAHARSPDGRSGKSLPAQLPLPNRNLQWPGSHDANGLNDADYRTWETEVC